VALPSNIFLTHYNTAIIAVYSDLADFLYGK
jgi:hypothetical protein